MRDTCTMPKFVEKIRHQLLIAMEAVAEFVRRPSVQMEISHPAQKSPSACSVEPSSVEFFSHAPVEGELTNRERDRPVRNYNAVSVSQGEYHVAH